MQLQVVCIGYKEVQYQGTWVGCYAAQVWVAETELLPGGGSSPISSPIRSPYVEYSGIP